MTNLTDDELEIWQEPRGCRYVTGEPGHGLWWYCQQKTTGTHSFCDRHHALCWEKPPLFNIDGFVAWLGRRESYSNLENSADGPNLSGLRDVVTTIKNSLSPRDTRLPHRFEK